MSMPAINAALKGGTLGLALGLAVVTWRLLAVEAPAPSLPFMLLPLATAGGGVALGLFLNKRKTN
ncbi:hypothetical protein DFR40_3142 [Azonexus fungiphilus]|uniref:Uncharacterized protein n=1 Tax=Azonexus fungiphilus TaxID=146940 RepID=A0A495VKW2_9RHOO|nr:hypothetical protein [Azonexus fungiphilus]RKT49999.1 hypothetical protein DFR40_3142 [Azonexus fungiphilus]